MAALESSNIDMKDCELFSQFCVPVLLVSLAAARRGGGGGGGGGSCRAVCAPPVTFRYFVCCTCTLSTTVLCWGKGSKLF